jgi:hypothetical protein
VVVEAAGDLVVVGLQDGVAPGGSDVVFQEAAAGTTAALTKNSLGGGVIVARDPVARAAQQLWIEILEGAGGAFFFVPRNQAQS